MYWNVAVTLFDSFMVIWIESSLLETSPDQLLKNDSSFFGIGVSFMTVPSAKLSSLVMVLVFTISFSTEPRPWMLIAKEYFFSSEGSPWISIFPSFTVYVSCVSIISLGATLIIVSWLLVLFTTVVFLSPSFSSSLS